MTLKVGKPAAPAAVKSGVVGKLLEIEAALNKAFQERDHLTRGVILALLTRQHVLVHGGHGTAKSKLVTALFRQIEGNTFVTQFSEGLTEDFVIGPPNVALLQKEGIIEHNTAGMLPEAEFAYLEELFDATGGLLRGTLLTILNERVFLRGAQKLDCPLWSAVATTNFYKVDDPKLAAVLDRFLIRVKVGDIQEDAAVEQMLCNHVEGAELKAPRVTASELRATYAKMQGVDIELSLVQLFMLLLKELAKVSGASVHVSDRRKCLALDLMRAHAVLEGRTECTDDDLDAVRYGLVNVGNEGEETYFEAALVAAKATYEATKQHADVDNVIRKSLAKLRREYEASATNAKKLGELFQHTTMITNTIEKQRQSGKLPAALTNKFEQYAKDAKTLGDEITAAFSKVENKQ